MYLPAEVVLSALRSFTQAELHCSKKEPIAGVRLDGSPTTAGYAYLLRGSQAQDPNDPRTLICMGAPACPPARYILVDESADLLRVMSELQELYTQFPSLETRLARAAAEEGYDSLLQQAAAILGNSVTLMDNNNRVRSAVSLDNRRQPSAENAFHTLRLLRQNGDLDYVASLTEPTECRFSYFSASCIITNLFLNGKRVGRLVVVCHVTPPNAKARFVCSILADYLQRKIARDEAFGYIRADDPLYSMFYELFSGQRLAKELITDRLNALPGWQGGAFRVLAIPLRDDVVSFTYYSEELSKQFDAYSVLMNETLLCCLHTPDERSAWLLEPQLDSFLAVCEQAGGLSNVFTRIEELRERAQQATTALRFSAGERLSIYAKKMLPHILTYFPREQRHLLVHPALYRLRNFDEQHGTAYLDTLRVYLESERSLAGTAQRLYIHRNTLLYRLEKLRELVSLDLDDPALRLHLLFSFCLMADSRRRDSARNEAEAAP